MFARKPLLLAVLSILMPVLAASAQTSPTDRQQPGVPASQISPALKDHLAVAAEQDKQTESQSTAVVSKPISVSARQLSQSDSVDTASQSEMQTAGVASFETTASATQSMSVSAVPTVAAQKTGGTFGISQRSPAVQSQISAQSGSSSTGPTENQQFTTANSTCGNISLGVNGSLNGFVPSPNDAWHQDITNAPVDPNSATIISEPYDLGNNHLHPDFGTGYGIPFNVVDSSISSTQTQYQMPMTWYASDSDLTYYPVKLGMAIEGTPADCTTNDDQHLIVIDRHSCTDYETWLTQVCQGTFSAANGLLFDFLTTEQRPYGMTSADASGLSVFEGLVRYDEILAGSINHAIRFTMPLTKNNQNNGYFVAPATHAAGTNWGTDNKIGMRIRLKASFDVSGFSPTNQIILNAMKQYGMILADNGSGIFFQGTLDPRWDDDDLSQLSYIFSNNFDVIQMPPAYDANSAPTGPPPVITNFTATPTTSGGKTYYILKANVSGATYSFMDQPGVNNGVIFRGYMAVQPTKTTTYTLTSRNLYGTTQAQVTITVK